MIISYVLVALVRPPQVMAAATAAEDRRSFGELGSALGAGSSGPAPCPEGGQARG
jgi:hypothetical protein